MAENKKVKPKNDLSIKRAILPRGKFQDELIKPRWNNEIAIRNLADDLFGEYSQNDDVIWLQDFFIKRMITKKQIQRMRTRSEYFAEIYSLCKDMQESRLVKAGLNGQGNINQVIFALKNVSKWSNFPKDNEDEKPPKGIIDLVPDRLAATDFDNNEDDSDSSIEQINPKTTTGE